MTGGVTKRHWHRISFFHLISVVFGVIKRNYKLIGALTLVYAVLYFTFAQGISSLDVAELRDQVSNDLNVEPESLGGRFMLAGLIFESSGASDDVGTTYLFIIDIIVALAFIWILRHAWLEKKTTIKEAFYKGMYPLVQFMTIVAIGILQLIPVFIGVYLLRLATQDVLVSVPEVVGGYLLLLVLPLALSIFMLTTTVFALIIVTIPEMTPMQAYRASKDLIKHKRSYISKHFLFFFLSLAVIILALLLITIALVPALAPIVGFIVSVILLPLLSVFIYTLYRSLVGE